MSSIPKNHIFSKFILIVIGISCLSLLSYLKPLQLHTLIKKIPDPGYTNLDTGFNHFAISGKIDPPQNTYVHLYRWYEYEFMHGKFIWPSLISTERTNDSGEFVFPFLHAGRYWVVPIIHSILNPIVPLTLKNHTPPLIIIKDPFDKFVKKH